MTELRFSRRTGIAAIRVMEGRLKNHSDLTRLFLTWGPDVAEKCDGGSIADRFNRLTRYIDEDPTRRTYDGELVLDLTVETAVGFLPWSQWGETDYADTEANFLRSLDRDGFSFSQGALRRTLPQQHFLPDTEDQLTALLRKHSFNVPLVHLNEAIENHTRGNWPSANSQMRTFLEALLDEICVRVDPSSVGIPSGQVGARNWPVSIFFPGP